MTNARRLARSTSGTAAAEMALVLPLLLIILFGSFELGNYFRSEHILVKAVRDGARFAGRQSFTYYEACSGSVGEPLLSDTRNVVKTGLASGGTDRLPGWDEATIDVEMSCSTTAGGQSMSGIYFGRANGAPLVNVTATVPYTPVLASAFGFSGAGANLTASQQAVVSGI